MLCDINSLAYNRMHLLLPQKKTTSHLQHVTKTQNEGTAHFSIV
jgi:hypothetical protein